MNKGQIPFDLPHDPAIGAQDFIVTPTSLEAYNHLTLWPNWTAAVAVLSGPEGTGKSHLTKIWQDISGAQVVGLSDVGDRDLPDCWVLEDIDRAAPDEEALFHLLNRTMVEGHHGLITARREIDGWGITTADVTSRLRLATQLRLGVPDDALLSQVLVKLFSDRQIQVDAATIKFLTARMERSLGAANRLVKRMDGLALAAKKPVTRAVAAQALLEEEQ